jgi:hypothetical protein
VKKVTIVLATLSIIFHALEARGQDSKPKAAAASIVIFREHKALWGRALKLGIEVDGFPLGAIPQGRYVAVRVAPGRHIVRGDSAAGARASVITPLGLVLGPGQTVYVRVFALRTGFVALSQIRMQTVEEDRARQWLKECKPAEDNASVDLSEGPKADKP